jgi:Protein of unknown function (DUF2867)
MRVPNAVHRAHPWVIEQIAPDFQLLDAWALPAEGGPDDFPSLVEIFDRFDPTATGPALVRALFAVRHKIGAALGWDDPTKKRRIPGSSDTSLSARLPDDLRDRADGPALGGLSSAASINRLYRTDREAAVEVANDTVHGVLHLSWVEQSDGRYRGHLAVYVKTRGTLGRLYLLLIQPFRHVIVYPALMREIGRAWQQRDTASTP